MEVKVTTAEIGLLIYNPAIRNSEAFNQGPLLHRFLARGRIPPWLRSRMFGG